MASSAASVLSPKITARYLWKAAVMSFLGFSTSFCESERDDKQTDKHDRRARVSEGLYVVSEWAITAAAENQFTERVFFQA